MTVAELISRMSAREFMEWRTFYSIEPWGELRRDMRMASLCHVTASAGASGAKKLSMRDFMPNIELNDGECEEGAREMSPEELWTSMNAMAEGYAIMTGNKVIRS